MNAENGDGECSLSFNNTYTTRTDTQAQEIYKKKVHEKRTSPIVERMRLCYLVLLLNARPIAGIFFARSFSLSHSVFFPLFFFTRRIASFYSCALSCWPRRCRRLKTQVFYIDAKALQLGFVSRVFTIALHQQQFSRLTFFFLSRTLLLCSRFGSFLRSHSLPTCGALNFKNHQPQCRFEHTVFIQYICLSK